MAKPVVMGAMLKCSEGLAPSTFVVTPESCVTMEKVPAAHIMDNIPMKNIMPFGMCKTMANPTVSAATSAALGVLTPMPCVPVVAAPWAPGCATVTVGGKPALTDACKCTCNWGGVIEVTNAGTTKETMP